MQSENDCILEIFFHVIDLHGHQYHLGRGKLDSKRNIPNHSYNQKIPRVTEIFLRFVGRSRMLHIYADLISVENDEHCSDLGCLENPIVVEFDVVEAEQYCE